MPPSGGHRAGNARPWLPLVLAGAVGGLAWSAALRAFMAEAAGPEASFSWIGTFGAILLPGAVVGGLLGRAEHVRRTGGRPGWRRSALAPLTFAVLDPAALMVVLPAMAGGYALSGRGSRWVRWATAAFAVLPVPAYLIAVTLLDDVRRLTTPRGAWTAVLLFALLAVFTIACSVPHRKVVSSATSGPDDDEPGRWGHARGAQGRPEAVAGGSGT
jgi:hypothetical protein